MSGKTSEIKLSDEQKQVLFEVSKPGKKFIKIMAIAGSGKTATLKAITDIVKPKNALYLAYNKAIADESKNKFNKDRVTCSTTHSLAYHYIVKRIGYNIGTDITGRSFIQNKMSYPKQIEENKEILEYYNHYLINLEYARKDLMASVINKFLLSSHLKLADFANEEYVDILEPEEIVIATAYVNMMKDKKVPITHAFYLKMLHIFLATKKIVINNFDLLMLDEAGDINPVTLEIFNLIECDKKIMVGDDQQNIYSFNATINGFKATQNIGTTFDLSKSYRVSQDIAKHIEPFCKKFLNKEMTFNGVEYTEDDMPPKNQRSVAYIFRTNAGLVDKMLELERSGQTYNITRSVESLFRMHRAIIFCKPGGTIFDPDLQFIQADMEEWDANPGIKRIYPSFIGYLKQKNEQNIQVQTAIQTILKYGGKVILELYKQAKAHEDHSEEHSITLTTMHASKGMEFDIVHIGDDMNKIIDDLIDKYKDELFVKCLHASEIMYNQELEEFRLYYVGTTRAKFKLYNAKHLSDEYIIEDKNFKPNKEQQWV